MADLNERELTNADDVEIVVRGDSTSKAGPTGRLMVSDFELSESGDSETKSGVGNHGPQYVTHGNVEYELSLDLEGEDAELYEDVHGSREGVPPDLQVVFTGDSYKWIVPHFWPDDKTYSGSDGDAVAFSISGPSFKPIRRTL